LAEDDDEMRHMLEAELRADGYVVFPVNDGTEMLEALSEASRLPSAAPDVIVMDVRMPGYSGLHVLAALRAAQWTTPVILITAFGDARLHEEAAKLGADVVFDKPFDVDDLRTALLHLVGRRGSSERTQGV
jgi:DNA-binding response OmpR family regulator